MSRLYLVLVELVSALNIPEALSDVANAARQRREVEFGLNDGLLGGVGHLVFHAILALAFLPDALRAVLDQVFDEALVFGLVPIGWQPRRLSPVHLLHGLLRLGRCRYAQRQSLLLPNTCHNLKI